MADFLNIFAALEQGDCRTISCTILDGNDDVILLAAVACFMRKELTLVNGYFEVTIPAYLSGEFENHFGLLTQDIKHTGRNPTGNLSGRPAILPEKQMLLFLWIVANRELNCIVRAPTLGRETKPDISCEWNTKFSIIPEIPTSRVHSKRIPKFSKTFPEIFYRSIQFRTGNLGIFGRMESAQDFNLARKPLVTCQLYYCILGRHISNSFYHFLNKLKNRNSSETNFQFYGFDLKMEK